MPFISKDPQLILKATECMNDSIPYENQNNENILTIQDILNTLAFSDQLMIGHLKDQFNDSNNDLEAMNIKNKVIENFWNWTYHICWYIRCKYLKDFDLEVINNNCNYGSKENKNNYHENNNIHLSTPELAAALAHYNNDDNDHLNTDNDDFDQGIIFDILNLHKNLCFELSNMKKGYDIDNKKKILFLWWFVSYNLLRILNNMVINLYDNQKLEKILGNDFLNKEYSSMNIINFVYSTHSGFNYFSNDLLSYSNRYLNALEEDHVLLLFFKEDCGHENHHLLFNILKNNNMKYVPMTFNSFITKMKKSKFYKERNDYESIRASKNIKDFTVTKQLGKGSSGFIRNAIHNKTGKKVIIKYVVKSLILRGCWTNSNNIIVSHKKKEENENNNRYMSNTRFPNEIAVLQYIYDELNGDVPDNLTTLITYWDDSLYYYLVFPDSDFDSDLFDYIDKSPNVTMSENEAKTIFRNILKAVQILHHNNIVHRDIKDENVLINYQTKEIQLIDFGSSTFYRKDQKLSNFVGSFLFAAPEIIKGMTYDGPQQDIWSLGILLYTMIFKATPFNDYYEILRGRMKFPKAISKECKDLILWMTNKDINERPTIDQVLSHQWIK